MSNGEQSCEISVATGNSRGVALVVDDEAANRLLLEMMLRREGFEVVTAETGVRAVEVFSSRRIDIVFMDVMMPELNGYEATRQIKSLCGDAFVPVIFLTALRDTEAIVKAIAAGGDDLLGKPFNFAVLNARVRAMERVRDLHRTVADKHAALSLLHEQVVQDQTFAEQIFKRVINDGCRTPACVTSLQKSADTFCGDLVLSAILPDGRVRVLVADFTGHGLAAAVGSVPVADEFKFASEAGLDDFTLLQRLNERLYSLLPADVFMAACLLTFDMKGFSYWNGGMPASYVKFHDRVLALKSNHLALGILPSFGKSEIPQYHNYDNAVAVVVSTDGLSEACDESGRQLGDVSVKTCIALASQNGSTLIKKIEEMAVAHIGHAAPADDLTTVVIDIKCYLSRCSGVSRKNLVKRVKLELFGSLLASPDLQNELSFLSRFGATHQDLKEIETIATELYNNALDHGLLGLDSRLKHDSDGFESYYEMRGAALSDYVPGQISITLSLFATDSDLHAGYTLEIRVSDSGGGFQSDRWLIDDKRSDAETFAPWGRGISLVSGLCDSLEYNSVGNEATASFSWMPVHHSG